MSLSELGHGVDVAGSKRDTPCKEAHDAASFAFFGFEFKLAYLGPAMKSDARSGTVQYVMDENATPDEPSAWPPAQRPVYWRHESGTLFV